MVDTRTEYANRQRLRLEDRRNNLSAEGNETERSLGSQLMLISTVLLTGNVIFLGNISNVNLLSPNQKILVLSGLVFVTSSIVAGIAYYLETIQFYEKWAKALDEGVDVFAKGEYEDESEAHEKVMAAQLAQPAIASKRSLFIQLGLLFGAACSYILFVVALFVNFHGYLTIWG